ncbi:bacterial low temperature requirement protein A [Lactobacillus hamsteri DSM 5661 = JCM 6256]|uniref:Bacterial low temperature requirement protein A n=2 Tax=Lactobacillus hamsteri TaxID=96565 RepID=A0A0R1YE26_9LACO|nr:low temperature requirement protein A [Lactobacillus hamsteri]KRM40720.1 bacterial low temperature requirement protein A [Lactobacillus hamsteri DSM 5661 = JCM 6256]
MIELFYDLVFAYMISQATELLHNLQHGIVGLNSFLLFFLVVIVFINSWMIQSVFTNRYGQSSWTDITFYFVNMIILLFMTNSFSVTVFKNLRIFFVAAGLLSLTLGIQYLFIYFKTNEIIDKTISITFFKITMIRTVFLFIGGFLNNLFGFIIALLGILFSWILPAFTGKVTKKHPIIFSHLLERLTLLIIITFGEMIIGIADYFKPASFSIYSIIVFLIVAGLFFSYITEFDHLINEKQDNTTGNLLIYLHYFILFGLSLMTVTLKLVNEPETNMVFANSCLYGGMLLFYIGLFLANTYNAERYKFKLNEGIIIISLILIGYMINIFTLKFEWIVISSAIVVLLNSAILVKKLYQN